MKFDAVQLLNDLLPLYEKCGHDKTELAVNIQRTERRVGEVDRSLDDMFAQRLLDKQQRSLKNTAAKPAYFREMAAFSIWLASQYAACHAIVDLIHAAGKAIGYLRAAEETEAGTEGLYVWQEAHDAEKEYLVECGLR